MPRIFKGSESTLRLLIHTCNQEGKISDLKIALYTSDPSMAVEFTDRYTIDGNIVSLTVPNYAFGTMEDGVINYVAQGMIDDDTFLTERQSNYFLKTPANYTPTPMPEEVVLGGFTTTIVENGVFEYTPTDVDAWNKATIEVNVPDTNGSYDEGYASGKDDGYESGYQDGYNAGQPIKYNTIADIYGSPNDSTVTFKGLVALSFAYGNGYYIMFTDHTGAILLRNHQDFFNVGDECVVTATLRRDDTSSYISVLFSASVEVLSSNNYVVMPADAVELTNVDDLYIPNENGYAEMKYLYVDGKVGNTLSENFIRLETVASSLGNIGLRGDFKDWVEKLKEGDNIRVYMFTDNSTNNFDVKDIVQLGTEGGSCNLGEGEIYLTANDAGFYELYAADDGYDGWSKFYVTLENGGAIKIHKASDLLDTFNNGEQIDFGAYYYVGGEITDIQEVSVEWGNATYTLDNGFSVYRGKWFDGNPFSDENQIKVGAYIVVYGIIQNNNGILRLKSGSQVIAYQECEGGEIISCSLEDKWVTPSMGDRDDNGLIVVEEGEEYDGLSRVVIDPSTIYNEGVTAGKAEGGDLIIGTGDIYLSVNERGQRFDILPSEWGYDAFDKFIVELENFDLGGDTNIYDALSVHQLLMDGVISYDNKYIFKGQITEIQRIRPEYGDARYTLDGSLNVYNGQTMGYDIQVGDNVIVIGTLSEYNGAPQFNAGSEIKALWREGGSCNLEDKWVTPSMSDRDDNGLIVVDQSEGYDGLDRVVIDPTTIYNEGIEEGRNQGGGSGDCNIQDNKTVELDGERIGIYPDEGYNGISEVIVEAGRKAEEWREEGRWNVRDNLQSIEITENGRYSVDDQIYVESLRYNGGYHTDTISTYDINRIEVTFKADTSASINGQGQPFILGGSMWGLNESGEDNACARAIQYAFGRIVGYWEGKWTDAVGCVDGEWLTITLDENGMTVKYPNGENYMEYTHDNGNVNNGGDIFPFIIGGLGRRKSLEDGNYSASLLEDTQFRGLIKEVKINTNSMGEITYIPKNWGYGVWDRKVENTGEYLSALEPTEGEVTYNGEWERKYGEGWKEINVNIPTIQDYAKDYYYCPLILGDSGFGEAAKSWNADMVTLNNYDGKIIEDKLYVPTFGNKNEFRTKEKAKFIQSLKNTSAIGTMEFGSGVEYIALYGNSSSEFTNLTKLIIGEEMNTANFGSSTFPVLKEIWSYSTTSEINVYFSLGSTFNGSGTLYLKNKDHETEWKNSLPSDWTIVYI